MLSEAAVGQPLVDLPHLEIAFAADSYPPQPIQYFESIYCIGPTCIDWLYEFQSVNPNT